MKKTVGDIIILHICTKNHNHMRYSSWDTEWDIIFCHFRPFFALLTPSPSNNPKNQNFEKMKKASGDVIVLNLSNKKHDHMMYAYSDMECDRWPSSQGAGFPIQGSRVQNHWVAPRSTQPFILPRSIKWVPGISGKLVVKSKLPPRSGSSLEAVKFVFFIICCHSRSFFAILSHYWRRK